MVRTRLVGYDAFISYAREDEAQARALQLGLQRFAKHWYRLQALRVFRDRSVLSAGPGVWSALRSRLETSRWLVLLASPAAASSGWVEREVTWWREHKSVNKAITQIVIVHTAGTIAWGKADFDWDTTDALPRSALTDSFPEEPILAVLPRPTDDCPPYFELVPEALGHRVGPASRRVRRRRRSGYSKATDTLRACIEDVATAVHEVPKDRLVGEHLTQFRRTRHVSAAAMLSVLGLLAGLTFVYAQSEDRLRLNTAAQLVQRAVLARDVDPRLSLMLGIAADRIHPSGQTRAALVGTLTASRYVGTLDGRAVFAPNPSLAATVDKRTTVLWNIGNVARPRRLGTFAPPTGTWPAAAAFSPDGHVIAAGDTNGAVALWDVGNPARPVPLGSTTTARQQAEGSWVPAQVSIAFTPDSRTMAVGTGDAAPTLWDVRDPHRPTRLASPLAGHSAGVVATVISPDGRTLVTGDAAGTTLLWDITEPAAPRRLDPPPDRHTKDVSGLAWSAAGLLAVSSNDGTTVLFDVTSPAAARYVTTVTGSTVSFSATAPMMATGSIDGTTILWDVAVASRPRRIGTPLTGRSDATRSVAFTTDGRVVAGSGDEGTTVLWTTSDPVEPHLVGMPIESGNSALAAVAVAPDGRTAAASTANRSVAMFDVSAPLHPRQISPSLTAPGDEVMGVSIAPVRHLLATASSGVTLWDISDPSTPRQLSSPQISGVDGFVPTAVSVVFSPSGQLLAGLFEDGTVHLWDIRAPSVPRETGPPITGKVASVAFSPDGRTLAAGSYDSTLSVWDISDPAAPTRRSGPLSGPPEFRGVVASVAFSPNGALLATGSDNGTVILWNVGDPTKPSRVGPALDVAAAAASVSIAFSPDGLLLATATSGGSVALRDVSDPAAPVQLGQPVGGTLSAETLVFFPDGRKLAVGGWNGAIAVADLERLLNLRDHATDRACAITGRGLSREEWDQYVPDLDYEKTCPG